MYLNKIKILPQSLSNKIAAGEVVNRPGSVVKELIENSIDAKANHVTLITKEAGKSLIQVIDNGSGMPEEDAKVSFERHSTSKISSYEDLHASHRNTFRRPAKVRFPAFSQPGEVIVQFKEHLPDIPPVLAVQMMRCVPPFQK